MTDHYQQVEQAWGELLALSSQPVPKEKAIEVALNIYEFMFGKKFKGKTRLTSGRRYTWVRRGVLVVNPDFKQTHASGWRALVHDLSHYGHSRINPENNGHGRIHAKFEAEIAQYVVKKFLIN